ncbi:hypothetical protein AVEN_237767-1 [Araneus ventricosus]|uniref:Uncharacterized protein n=1 Tax=Araneus ventricosus TaxID=182803 RepID=A0A4Y2WBL0_ARAVE|nr:hypothetical protein AVEN_237767-1 [Araneus ventricosus]
MNISVSDCSDICMRSAKFWNCLQVSDHFCGVISESSIIKHGGVCFFSSFPAPNFTRNVPKSPSSGRRELLTRSSQWFPWAKPNRRRLLRTFYVEASMYYCQQQHGGRRGRSCGPTFLACLATHFIPARTSTHHHLFCFLLRRKPRRRTTAISGLPFRVESRPFLLLVTPASMCVSSQ